MQRSSFVFVSAVSSFSDTLKVTQTMLGIASLIALAIVVTWAIVAIASLPISAMLVVQRFSRRRFCGPGGLAWASIGIVLWLHLAVLLADVVLYGSNYPYYNSASLISFWEVVLGPFFMRDLIEELIETQIMLAPLGLSLVFLICGRSTERWWKREGDWPEWSGMWLLLLVAVESFLATMGALTGIY